MQIVFQPYPATIDQLKHWAEHDASRLSGTECAKALWILGQSKHGNAILPR